MIFLFALIRLAACGVCAYLAQTKCRSVGGWAAFGLVFPLIAVIAAFIMKSQVVVPDDDHYVNYY
jgi:hypothetical protein